jgi:hypothetical protein
MQLTMSLPRNKIILDKVKKDIACIRSFTVFAQHDFQTKIQQAFQQIHSARGTPPEDLRKKRERVVLYLEYVKDKKHAESLPKFVENPVIGTDLRFSWADQPDDTEKAYITDGEKKTQLMREAFDQVGAIYHLSELLNDIQRLFTPDVMRSLYRIEDEFNLIRNNQYYAMIATDTAKTRDEHSKRPQSPRELMEKIYGNVVFHIYEMIKSFHEQYPPNYAPPKHVGKKKPSEDEQRAKKLHDEYEKTMNELSKRNASLKFSIAGEKREVTTFEEWLHYIVQMKLVISGTANWIK